MNPKIPSSITSNAISEICDTLNTLLANRPFPAGNASVLGTFAPNFSISYTYYILLDNNLVIANPSDTTPLKTGDLIQICVQQDSTGGHNITSWGNAFLIFATPVSSTGTPALGSNRLLSITKTTSNFTPVLEAAPGVSNTVTYDWELKRN